MLVVYIFYIIITRLGIFKIRLNQIYELKSLIKKNGKVS